MIMRKKILSLAVVAMTLLGANSFAQSTVNEKTNSAKIENVKGRKADRKEAKTNPYEGLTLTDAQKTQLKQLDEKRAAQRKENAQAKKAEKQRDNSNRIAARKASKKQYLEEVKAIIGPEQYVVFLENFYINGQTHGDKSKMQASRHGNKKFAHSKTTKSRKGEKSKGQQSRSKRQDKKAAANNQTAQL